MSKFTYVASNNWLVRYHTKNCICKIILFHKTEVDLGDVAGV